MELRGRVIKAGSAEGLALVSPDHQGWGLESPVPQHLKHSMVDRRNQ